MRYSQVLFPFFFLHQLPVKSSHNLFSAFPPIPLPTPHSLCILFPPTRTYRAHARNLRSRLFFSFFFFFSRTLLLDSPPLSFPSNLILIGKGRGSPDQTPRRIPSRDS
ncbi:hypothetical protein F4809DRAFT_346170 [Biscogniauxia mediterranea]|nr:hypothetical protein F4809DRAFT_346170 [Biscogniauxia mediterranea]